LDALINHIQKNFVTAGSGNNFLVMGFTSAGTAGVCILMYMYITGKMQFHWKHVLAGICIGVPNYFSIWCVVKFLQVSPWQSSASFPVNNMGIVLFSALIAWLVFKEKLSAINWAGIALSVVAIYLIAFGDAI
ncbi:MAG TPA: EamA family transporter, partial [Chitinophagaceae bacterium]|nr:EamA family transporter [Chitinophagaceae bacterium]